MICIRLMVRAQNRPNFLFIHPACLSICAYSGFHKYFLVVFKLMHGFQIYYDIFRVENGMYKIEGSCTETHKRLKRHCSQMGKNFLKSILSCFYFSKYNEINMRT